MHVVVSIAIVIAPMLCSTLLYKYSTTLPERRRTMDETFQPERRGEGKERVDPAEVEDQHNRREKAVARTGCV